VKFVVNFQVRRVFLQKVILSFFGVENSFLYANETNEVTIEIQKSKWKRINKSNCRNKK